LPLGRNRRRRFIAGSDASHHREHRRSQNGSATSLALDQKRTRRARTHTDSHLANCVRILCQNCVRCPSKPWANTVIYGDTPRHIVVAGSRCWRVRWCVSACVSERERNQFPSVLLQPLGHLSALESMGYKRLGKDYRTRLATSQLSSITFAFSGLARTTTGIAGNCVKPRNVSRFIQRAACRVSPLRASGVLGSAAGCLEATDHYSAKSHPARWLDVTRSREWIRLKSVYDVKLRKSGSEPSEMRDVLAEG